MYLLLENFYSPEERQAKLEEFILCVGIELFKKCQANKFLSQEDKEKITINLCIAYVKNRTKNYFKKITCGVIKMEIDHLMISGVVKLSKELQEQNNSTISV